MLPQDKHALLHRVAFRRTQPCAGTDFITAPPVLQVSAAAGGTFNRQIGLKVQLPCVHAAVKTIGSGFGFFFLQEFVFEEVFFFFFFNPLIYCL